MSRIPLPPYPNGWFAVAHSDQLARGQTRPLHYLGRDLVLWRGEDGQVRAAEAYCPHLGAHLGKGGKVEGDTIRCPFHGWRFDGRDGRCVEIPYAKRIPPAARLDTLPAQECNGMVLVWHHLEGEEPEWQPEVVPEIQDPHYVLHDTHEWTIASHPQEIMENGVDFAHFATLHGWKCKAIHWEPDGPYYRLKIDVDTGAEDQAATPSVTTDVDSFNSGPGFLYTRFKGEMDGIAVNALTPIGPELLHIQHRYYAHERCKPEVVKAFYEFYVNDYNLDIPIWSNKIYREKPLLAEPEKDFGRFRRWYRQFYSTPPSEESRAS